MDRSIPVFNRVVVEKTQRLNMQSHLRRLEDIRATNRKAASTMRVTDYNPKKGQLEEEKRTQIEKQNILLYNKMSKILNRSRNRGSQSFNVPLKETRIRSLNRIQEENKEMLRRIENQRPTISNKKFYLQHNKREKILKFIGAYHYKPRFTGLNVTNNSSWSIDNKDVREYKRSERAPSSSEVDRRSKLERKFQKMQEFLHPQPEMLPEVRETKEYPSREVPSQRGEVINLYRKRITLEGEIYLATINRLYQTYEFILQNSNQEEYRLSLPESQGNKVLTDFDYDFGFVCSCLKIRSGKLQLMIDRVRDSRITSFHSQQNSNNNNNRRLLINEQKLIGFKLQPENIEEDEEERMDQGMHEGIEQGIDQGHDFDFEDDNEDLLLRELARVDGDE